MATSQSLEQQQRQHGNQNRRTVDNALPAHSHKGEDTGYRKSAGNGFYNFGVARSATGLVFHVAPPSITGISGLPLLSCLRRCFVDEPGSAFGTVYCPELSDCTNSTSKADRLCTITTSASSCKRNVLDSCCSPWCSEISARETGEFSRNEPHAGYDDDNSDALLHARNAKEHGNAQHGLGEDLQVARCGPLVRAYGTVPVKRPPTAHAISVDHAVQVVNFYNH